MASSRLSRFVMEVAPPQFVSVMRYRSRKMMDTISEEDRDVGNSDCHSSSSSCISAAATAASSSAAVAVASANSKYFLKGVRSSFSIFEN
ncbi:hypothetical protein SLE2022_306200 [Rubroshorea leprosula]